MRSYVEVEVRSGTTLGEPNSLGKHFFARVPIAGEYIGADNKVYKVLSVIQIGSPRANEPQAVIEVR